MAYPRGSKCSQDSCGGLGLRTAIGAALPAFVASRIMCRPLVTTMVDHFSAAFGTPSQPILAEYDTRTDEALSRLVSTLPTAAAQELLAKLDEAVSERELLLLVRDLPTPWRRRAPSCAQAHEGPGHHHHLR